MALFLKRRSKMYLLDEHARDCIRKAGRLSGEARELGRSLVSEGVKLRDVAERMELHILEHGGKLAFPVNISLNEMDVHRVGSRVPQHLAGTIQADHAKAPAGQCRGDLTCATAHIQHAPVRRQPGHDEYRQPRYPVE